MIIDGNVHITSNGKWFSTDHDASVEALIAQMDDAGVERSLVVPLPGTVDNKTVVDFCSQFPDRLMPAYTFNPGDYKTVEEAAKGFDRLATLPFSVLKFHNRFGGYDPGDTRFTEVLRINASQARPHVIMICGLLNDRNSLSYTDPVPFFFNLAVQFPNTVFIAAHGAGSHLMQLADACRDLPNFFIDLSFSITRYKNSSVGIDMKWLCEKLDRKLLWGSDFPEVKIADSLSTLREMVSNTEKFNNIAGNNLAKILGL